MAVSPGQVAHRIRREAAARQAAAETRAHDLRAKLGPAAELLHCAGASRVWLFGSLAAGTPNPESDVDMAVLGLPGSRYFEVLAALMTLFGTCVDLVALERAPESLRQRILETGQELCRA